MHPLYHVALKVRMRLVSQMRMARQHELASESKAPISVLFYHRIADTHPNSWTLSNAQFQRHLDYCRAHFEMIDLAEVQRRVRMQDSCSPATSITFDDGYEENCDVALPLLIERKIPCTYFVATSNILNQTAFPHDLQQGAPLAVNHPRQIRELAEAGIEIGCHTRTHVDFAKIHDPDTVRNEIIDAKDELEQMIGMPVRYFAFPFGMPAQLTQAAIEAVAAAGFAGFCSAFGGYNLVGRDAFHIRRCHADPEFARLQNWLSFDRGKLLAEPQIRYFVPPLASFEKTVEAMNAADAANGLAS